MAKLTAKAERFCHEILVDYHPRKAAERSGYVPGDAARGNAHRLLKNRQVIQRISEIKQELLPEMGRRFLLAELWSIIMDQATSARDKIMAIEKAAKVQHLYERDEATPGEVHVHLESRVTADEGSTPEHPADAVAEPAEESK